MLTNVPTLNFPANLNTGSLRKLAEKTATGMLNRFGAHINAELELRQWGEDYEILESVIQQILEVMLPAVAATVYESYGYEAPDGDQRGAPVFEGVSDGC